MNFMKMFKTTIVLSTVMCAALSFSHVALAQQSINSEVESKVREYFADIPVMIDIAKCETTFRQFNADGSTLFDRSGTYIGVYQINEQLHYMTAWDMDMNLYTLEGNMAYARYLYGKNGINPWKGCVPVQARITTAPQSAKVPTSTSSAAGLVTRNLRIGMSNSEVTILQTILNKAGFVITDSGPGSPGNETNLFGGMTREALKKYQCARNIVCEGNEAVTGFGRVGPMTREALNKENTK